jgi:hypothetical protein
MTQTQNPAAKTILVLHNIEDLSRARRSTLDHIYCFERYAPQHNYVYHRSMLPVTDALRTTPWDAVIFESTSLGIVTLRPRSRFQHLREQWRFLRDIPAVKLAFPQDDATHSAHLDYFCSNLGVDAVFSVRPERKEQLYPLTSERAEFVSTVAGYIDDMSLDELSGLALGDRAARYVLSCVGRPFREAQERSCSQDAAGLPRTRPAGERLDRSCRRARRGRLVRLSG